jgi:hypothetical protein
MADISSLRPDVITRNPNMAECHSLLDRFHGLIQWIDPLVVICSSQILPRHLSCKYTRLSCVELISHPTTPTQVIDAGTEHEHAACLFSRCLDMQRNESIAAQGCERKLDVDSNTLPCRTISHYILWRVRDNFHRPQDRRDTLKKSFPPNVLMLQQVDQQAMISLLKTYRQLFERVLQCGSCFAVEGETY